MTEASVPLSKMFNLVIVPTSAYVEGDQTLLLSAMRHDRGLRMVSSPLREAEVRRALARAGATGLQTEQLLRGNRMAYGGRRTDHLRFSEQQLLAAGMVPEQGRPAAEI